MLELVARDVSGCAKVLELGSGTGIVTVTIARNATHLVATDYVDAMVDSTRERIRAEELSNVEFATASVDALPFEEETFDAVVPANVLHLVPNVEGALRSIKRVLRPRGRILVPTYCHAETIVSALVSRALALTSFPSRRRLTLQSLARAVQRADISITHCELLPGLLPIGFVSGHR